MSLNVERAKALVEKIKEAKLKLAVTSGPRHILEHDEALNELRDAEDAYQDYLYSQRP